MTQADFRDFLEEALGVERGSLADSDTRDTISGWSSIVDVRIMAAISGELGIDPDAEIIEAESVGELLTILNARRGFKH
jgi:acyl carrier protein